MAMTVIFKDIWQQRTQKRTGFVIPFDIEILVTELPKYLTLVRISAQLRTIGNIRHSRVNLNK